MVAYSCKKTCLLPELLRQKNGRGRHSSHALLAQRDDLQAHISAWTHGHGRSVLCRCLLLAGWSADTYCDASTWTNVTTPDEGTTAETCSADATNCQYQDKISLVVVSPILGGNAHRRATPWPAAVNACANSTLGGFAAGAWRLPAQKEVLSLYSIFQRHICAWLLPCLWADDL